LTLTHVVTHGATTDHGNNDEGKTITTSWRREPHNDGWGNGTTTATNDSDDDGNRNVVCHG
jgi:hypothetical protein